MSHYIFASCPGGGAELDSTSGRTLRACAETGFDLYYEYGASDCDRGWSGSGGSREVSHEVAQKAFIHALAWVAALGVAWNRRKNAAEQLPPVEDRLAHPAEQPLVQSLPGVVGFGVPVWKVLGFSLEEYLEDQGDPIPADVPAGDRETATGLVPELVEALAEDPPDDETWERSLGAIRKIMNFTWETYQGTRTGPAVVSFS